MLRPRWVRIFLMTAGSSMAEMMRTLPPQAWQVSMSMLKTRLSNRAQVMRLCGVEWPLALAGRSAVRSVAS